MKNLHSFRDAHALEARLGARLAVALSAQVESLPADVSERLRFAREQSLDRVRAARRQRAAAGGVARAGSGPVATLAGFDGWWSRVASLLPLVLLVAGFLMIDEWSVREQVLVAAEIDARLLADDLPPAAYSDPGFAEYLRAAPTP